MTGRLPEAAGTRPHVEEPGPAGAPPVPFVHGGPGQDRARYARLVTAFTRRVTRPRP